MKLDFFALVPLLGLDPPSFDYENEDDEEDDESCRYCGAVDFAVKLSL